MLKTAIRAARAGGEVLLHHMQRLDALNIVVKTRMDYASEADEQAEAAIVQRLRGAYPDYAILGEEGGAYPGVRGSHRYTWVIDPLDGTSNYLRAIAHWCVSIALCEDGEPIHAVVFDPLHNELFTASRGGGAHLNGQRIRVSERLNLTGALIATGFSPRERERAAAQLDCLKPLLREAEDVRCSGSSALDLAHIACGRLDGSFEVGVQPWDMAAGVLLVREAGGRVCDFNGAAIDNLHISGARQMVAGNVRVADTLQTLVGASDYVRMFGTEGNERPLA